MQKIVLLNPKGGSGGEEVDAAAVLLEAYSDVTNGHGRGVRVGR